MLFIYFLIFLIYPDCLKSIDNRQFTSHKTKDLPLTNSFIDYVRIYVNDKNYLVNSEFRSIFKVNC